MGGKPTFLKLTPPLLFCLEPLNIYGEGEYNLNVVKEVEVTESYLGLDEKLRGCRSGEDFNNCTTQYYKATMIDNCECLPFSIAQQACSFRTYRNIKYYSEP